MRKRKEKGEEVKSGRKRWRERTSACVSKEDEKKKEDINEKYINTSAYKVFLSNVENMYIRI